MVWGMVGQGIGSFLNYEADDRARRRQQWDLDQKARGESQLGEWEDQRNADDQAFYEALGLEREGSYRNLADDMRGSRAKALLGFDADQRIAGAMSPAANVQIQARGGIPSSAGFSGAAMRGSDAAQAPLQANIAAAISGRKRAAYANADSNAFNRLIESQTDQGRRAREREVESSLLGAMRNRMLGAIRGQRSRADSSEGALRVLGQSVASAGAIADAANEDDGGDSFARGSGGSGKTTNRKKG